MPRSRLIYWLIALQVLNAFDAIMTLREIATGVARELNPLMRHALTYGPTAFLLIKLILVGSFGVLLIRFNARRTLIAMVFIYIGLACYHIVGSW